MRNKVTKKIISLVMVFASVFVFFVQSAPKTEADTVAIADFKSKVDYRWLWKNCKSVEDVKATDILDVVASTMPDDDLKKRIPGLATGEVIPGITEMAPYTRDYLYTFVLVSGNTDISYYFSSLPGEDEEYKWNNGNAKSSYFNPINKEFATEKQLSDAFLLYVPILDQERLDGNNVPFRFFRLDPGVVTFNGGYKKNIYAGNISGLYNDSFTDFQYSPGFNGEAFKFQFDSSRANGNTGNVRVIEADNTSYHWASYDNDQKYGETKKGRGDDEYFYLWIGHYVIFDGLDTGNYKIKADTVLTDDSTYAVIKKDATLTIEPGAALTVKGKLYLDGTIYNYGTIIIEDGGELIIGDTDDSFGELINTKFGSKQAGHIVIQNGGKLTVTPRMVIKNPGSLTMSVDSTKLYTKDANFINNGIFNLNGSADVYFTNSDFENCSEGVINIPASSSYTYDSFKSNFINVAYTHSFVNNGAVYSGSRKLN